jgi:NADH:ubiquinone oxidoreductase subunit 5 (subunit L)/multisubunit Na+/H+ antiporter MnhA subunit
MEGPTPVSALIHAATMVTAGVFLIVRCSFIIDLCPVVLMCMTYIGCATLIVSGVIGLFQNDIKKIVAYSTCSQLGYMVFSCGLSGYNLALFHLFNHAFFKALLFLACGSLIHALKGEQDIRKMGGLHRMMPITYISFLIGSASLIGAPFFSGFFSKDSILELAYIKLCNQNDFHLYFFALCGVALTTLYSLKLIFFSFFSAANGFRKITTNIKENESFFNAFPLMLLGVLSIFSGFFSNFFFKFRQDIFFETCIFVSQENATPKIFYEHVPNLVHFLPSVITVLFFFCFILYHSYLRFEINKRIFIADNFYRKT